MRSAKFPRVDFAQFVLGALLLAYLLPGGIVGTSFAAPVLQGSILLVFLASNVTAKGGKGAVLLGLGFSATMMLLTIVALVIDFDRSVLRDYAELAKYGMIGLAFVAGAVMSRVADIDRKLTIACLAGTFCFIVPGLLETSQSGAGASVKALYGRDLSVLVGKPILSFWTTYFAAAMYAFLASVLIASIVASRAHWLTHPAIALLFLLILLTQSRSGFLALVILVVAYLVALIIRRRYALLLGVSLVAMIGGVLAIVVWGGQLAVRFGYLSYGIQNYLLGFMDNMEGANSLGYRLDQIAWALENNGNIIIGAGIGKAYQPYLESYFSLFYYRYGISGILIQTAIWIWPGIYLLGLLIRKRPLRSTVIVAMGLYSLILPLLSVSSVITDQFHFLFVYYVVLGLWYGLTLDRCSREQKGIKQTERGEIVAR